MPLAAVGAAAGVSMLVGVLNGVLVTSLRLVPFIVTLGTMQMARGLSKFIAREQNIYPSETVRDLWIANLLDSPRTLFTPPFLPMAVWLVVLATFLAHLFLRYTRPGRHLFAIGSNEKTAVLCGVPVARTKVFVYLLGGLFSGLAGIIFFARPRGGGPADRGRRLRTAGHRGSGHRRGEPAGRPGDDPGHDDRRAHHHGASQRRRQDGLAAVRAGVRYRGGHHRRRGG